MAYIINANLFKSFKTCIGKEAKSLVLTGDLSSHQSDQKDFLGGTMVENLPVSARDARDTGSIPGSEDWIGNVSPLQYSAWRISWTV